MEYQSEKPSLQQERILSDDLNFLKSVPWELIIFAVLLILAFATRFHDLESRVMSHDENSHVYYSWLFSNGSRYAHDPITHGPLQFHLVATSLFLFGGSDFTARIPAALFSIALIAFSFGFRRYFGKSGYLITAFLFLISPYMLYYGRYVRNEALVALFVLISLWAILRYTETGENRYLYFFTVSTALHFTTKETSYIFVFQAIIFLLGLFIYRTGTQDWKIPKFRDYFIISILSSILLFAFTFGSILINLNIKDSQIGAEGVLPNASNGWIGLQTIIPGVVGILLLVGSILILISGYTWERLKNKKSFNILILLITLIIPLTSAFIVRIIGIDPLDYGNSSTIRADAIVFITTMVVSIIIGIIWKPKVWMINFGIFYIIFFIFYSSFFTNGKGIYTGLFGSLGYWLEQQGVHRGSQPWFYYIFVQIPFYEYLPAIGSIAGIGFAFIQYLKKILIQEDREPEYQISFIDESPVRKPPVLALLIYWTISTLLLFTYAGEKMPWLTVHITLPMILLTGWTLGKIVDSIDWKEFLEKQQWLFFIYLVILVFSLNSFINVLVGDIQPFQGQSLDEIQVTTSFIVSGVAGLGSILLMITKLGNIQAGNLLSSSSLFIFLGLSLLTARTSFRAAYENYDNAKEFLVYAHSATGVKTALSQIEEISRLTLDDLSIQVEYDNETSYPYWWYLRNYPNSHGFGGDPTRSIKNAPLILVGAGNYSKVEQIIGDEYIYYDFVRLWWPIQDYFSLTWDSVIETLKDSDKRSALFDLWLNRDYTAYGIVNNREFSLKDWQPSARMRLYVRKDVLYIRPENGDLIPTDIHEDSDQFLDKEIELIPDQIFGTEGIAESEFLKPHGMAIAPDGSIYVADTENHRIQQMDASGRLVNIIGRFGDVGAGQVDGGFFNRPFGVAVDQEGNLYVADTWNHRIQKFSAQGIFIKTWGYNGLAEVPEAFWGPRDVIVSEDGLVFVADTGNKRIVIFDQEGNYINQFGGVGYLPGFFDEPVGLAMDSQGNLYVCDTWNQRIQVFSINENGDHTALRQWDVPAWNNQALENKPYIAVDKQGYVYITDSLGYRVLIYTNEGEPVGFWGNFSLSPFGYGFLGGLSFDREGGLWIVDSENGMVLHYNQILPFPNDTENDIPKQ